MAGAPACGISYYGPTGRPLSIPAARRSAERPRFVDGKDSPPDLPKKIVKKIDKSEIFVYDKRERNLFVEDTHI